MMIAETIWSVAVLAAMVVTVAPAFAETSTDRGTASLTIPQVAERPEPVTQPVAGPVEDLGVSLRSQMDAARRDLNRAFDQVSVDPGKLVSAVEPTAGTGAL
jgi:hypothetical protein